MGARLSLVVAVVWWSACTALTAAGRGFLSLLGLRMLLGVGEAGAYPSFAKVAASWFPRSERSFASSIFDSGSRVGSALAIPLVSWVIATLGWRESFIITGVLGFVWAVFWMWLYREPENHPAVSAEELARSAPRRSGRNPSTPPRRRNRCRGCPCSATARSGG